MFFACEQNYPFIAHTCFNSWFSFAQEQRLRQIYYRPRARRDVEARQRGAQGARGSYLQVQKKLKEAAVTGVATGR